MNASNYDKSHNNFSSRQPWIKFMHSEFSDLFEMRLSTAVFQRLCIFGLYGVIQMLLLFLLLDDIVISLIVLQVYCKTAV